MIRKFFLLSLIGIIFSNSACTNAENEKNTTSDTIVKKDTIKSDPEKFSDPH